MRPRTNVNATSPWETSTPWLAPAPPVSTAAIAANNYRRTLMNVGPVVPEATNWGGGGTGLPDGGARAVPNELNGLTYGAAMGTPTAYVPRWTSLAYGPPVPTGGNRAPANQMLAAKAPVSTAGPAAPVVGGPPGPSYITTAPLRTTP